MYSQNLSTNIFELLPKNQNAVKYKAFHNSIWLGFLCFIAGGGIQELPASNTLCRGGYKFR